VLIGRREPDAGQTALLQRAQELDPEAARFDLADIQADDLPDTGLVHGIGDNQGLGDDAAVVTDLDVLRVKPQIRVGASSGRWRNNSTCSSRPRQSAETRSLVIPAIPSCSTSLSTFLVDTPFT
jgi:hypothetical protein